MTGTATAGMLVRHTVWGLGKVMEVPLPYLVVHFPTLATTADGARRKLQMTAPQLSIADVQSDPALDLIALDKPASKGARARAKRPKAPPKPMQTTLDQAIERFQADYPALFNDPALIKEELGSKRKAHADWIACFGDGKARAMLDSAQASAISDGLRLAYQGTNIPAPFEIMAVRDGLGNAEAATRLLESVLAFVDRGDAASFAALSDAVGSLPASGDGARVLTWPNVTVLPFLAAPTRFAVMKPTVTRRMARRMGFDLPYASPPTWNTYEALQRMSGLLMTRLSPLGAKDFIDVQSFIWATGDLE